jgi:hypothetical protein
MGASSIAARSSNLSARVTRAAAGRPSPLVIGLAFGGVAFTLIQLIVGFQGGLFPIPSRDALIWDRVGDAIWTGAPIYFLAPVATDSFWYAPPIAVAFATLSWRPIEAQALVLLVGRIVALRVIAGSWVGAGIACWFPLVAFDLGGGNFNLLIAAAIVLAVDRRPQLAVWAALAKLGPALAIDPRDSRKVVPIALVALAITLPWLHLWPEYVNHLLGNIAMPLGPQVPIPLWIRLAAAVALLALVRTRWARALAATIAIPAFYWGSLVVLIAPVAVLLRDRLATAREARA